MLHIISSFIKNAILLFFLHLEAKQLKLVIIPWNWWVSSILIHINGKILKDYLEKVIKLKFSYSEFLSQAEQSSVDPKEFKRWIESLLTPLITWSYLEASLRTIRFGTICAIWHNMRKLLLPHVLLRNNLNGWQLAKMKKSISWHVPAMKFIGMKQLV